MINKLSALWQLIKRNMLVFFKDKTSVFFSFLAPLIILLLYVLFLKTVQIDSNKAFFESQVGVVISDDILNKTMDAWVISGMLGISCLTIPLNCAMIMVQDKEKKTIYDFKASPLAPLTLTLAYFIAFFLVNFILVLLVAVIGVLYLVIFSHFVLQFTTAMALLGYLLLGSMSGAIASMFILRWFKSTASASALIGIVCAVGGFFLGAYMPLSTMPAVIQYLASLLPGAHTTALFRNLLMNDALVGADQFIYQFYQEGYDFNLNFFGTEMSLLWMIIYLATSSVVLIAGYALIEKFSKHEE